MDINNINLGVAFLGGITTFFATCLLPLVPTYIAYLAGTSLENTQNKRRYITTQGILFTLGFIGIFILLGATANTLGRILSVHRDITQRLGGIFFIFVGLFMLEIIKPMWAYREHRFKMPRIVRWQSARSIIAGVIFGFAWTPCIGPLLSVILFWASQKETLGQGVSLLTSYGIGLGLPFIVTAYFLDSISTRLHKVGKLGKRLQQISALLIIIMGILLTTNKLSYISTTIIHTLELNKLQL